MAQPVPVTQPAGPAAAPPGEPRVNVVMLDGSSFSVPESELPAAIAAGAKIDTGAVAERKGQLRKADAASSLPTLAQSAVQSVPFVGGMLSQELAAATGRTMAEVEAEQVMSPLASALGTAGGIGLQIAATSGLGAGALGAKGAQASVAARTALGAGEGAFYGAGSAVNDAWLHDQPLTAESLLTSAGGGALFGGALAGGLSVVGERLERAAAQKFTEKAGTAARTAKAGELVGQDLRTLQEAGISPRMVDQAFKEGIFKHGQLSPLEVQTAVASRLAAADAKVMAIGQQLESSAQTVDLLKLVKGAAKETGGGAIADLIKSGAVGAADELAPVSRVMQIRQSLLAEPAAAGFVKKIDDKLYDLAFQVEPRFGVDTAEALSRQRDFLRPLARAADEAVAAGPGAGMFAGAGAGAVPGAAGAAAGKAAGGGFADVLGALGRQGDHLGAIGAVLSMAGSAHPATAFLSMAAGNILRRVADNPARIADTLLETLGHVSKATNLTREELAQAVTAAVTHGSGSAGGIAAGKLAALDGAGAGSRTFAERALKQGATDADVQAIRQQLLTAEQNNLQNGHPDVGSAIARQRQLLVAALPPPTGNPAAPAALSRPGLGPSPKQVQKYNDTLRGLTMPMGVLARVGRGRATDTEVRTVAVAFPALAARAGQMMLDLAAKSDRVVSLSTKRAVEILRQGASFDPAVTPSKVARIQKLTYALAPAPGRGGAAAGGDSIRVNSKGLGEIEIGDRISNSMMDASDEARGAKK